jgi:hypothetical protein
MRKLKLFVISFLVILLASSFVPAQTPTGKFVGKVVDDQGNGLPGVTVEAISPKLVGKAVTVSDANGAYRLLALPSGVYEITFTLQGFKKIIRKDVILQLQQTIVLDVTMEPAAVEESVTVIGMSPLIDVKSTVRGMTMTKEVFSSLPKGRDFDSLITAIPGVSYEPMLAGTSVDGASGLENMYYVDGAEINNLLTGSRAQAAAFEFVDEVQVRASGYQAEYGGSLGGVISVITRSGGNAFHGEVMGYYSGAPLRTEYRDVLTLDYTNSKIAKYYKYNEYYGVNHDNRYEVGFNLGGYILRDKLWFFASFLPVFYNNTRDVTYLTKSGAPGPERSWKRTENYWNWNAKLTAQLFGKLRLSASVVNNFNKYKGDLNNAYGGNPDPFYSYDLYGFSYPNFSGAIVADLTLGNNFLASLRGGYFMNNRTNQLLVPPDEPCFQFMTEAPGGYFNTTNIGLAGIPEEYQRGTGWYNFPRANSQVNNAWKDERYNISGDLTYFLNAAGEHAFKAGVMWVRTVQDHDYLAKNPVLFFAWDRDMIAYGVNYGRGKYGYYGVRGNDVTGPFGQLYKAHSNRWSLYIQDSWTLAGRLTLNLGLRAESEYLPPGYTQDPQWMNATPISWSFGDKLAPRFGAVWDVMGDSTLKVFGSLAWYYDVMKLNMAVGSYGGDKWKSTYYALDDYRWPLIGVNNYFPGRLLFTGNPEGTLDFRAPSYDSTDPDMKPMTMREISLGGEYRIRENLALSVRGVYKHLVWAYEDIGILLPDGEHYFITNPGGPFITEKYAMARAAGLIPEKAPNCPKAKRDYWGFNIALDKRFSNNWQGGLSFTYSSLTGNYNGLVSGDEYGRQSPNTERYFDLWYLAFDYNLNPLDGALPGDRPLYFKLYGSYTFNFGLTAGIILNAMSGIPTSTEWALDVQGYLPYNRNDLGRTPFLWYSNFYLAYDFKIKGNTKFQINVNVDNLFDIKTAQRIYAIYNRGAVAVSDAVLAGGAWDINDYHPVLDPQFKKERDFYGPLTVRLGFAFSF